MSKQYAAPEVIVTTDWVEEHRSDTDRVRIVECNEDVLLYEKGHIPEAVRLDWHTELQHQNRRDYIGPEEFAELCAAKGISNDTEVILYGDKSNWWACYAFWVFKMFGHERCRVMDGGRQKWEAEDRELSRQKPSHPRGEYRPPAVNTSNRAFRDDTLAHAEAGKPLIDVRSPQEFTGELTHMPDYPQEGALRGGHIPGARNIPWAKAVQEDGTFKTRAQLEQLYLQEQKLKADDDVVVYCRIGERSSHTWFVLKYLLGFTKVRNYDGSWTEWGNAVGLPIATGPEPGVPGS